MNRFGVESNVEQKKLGEMEPENEELDIKIDEVSRNLAGIESGTVATWRRLAFTILLV